MTDTDDDQNETEGFDSKRAIGVFQYTFYSIDVDTKESIPIMQVDIRTDLEDESWAKIVLSELFLKLSMVYGKEVDEARAKLVDLRADIMETRATSKSSVRIN